MNLARLTAGEPSRADTAGNDYASVNSDRSELCLVVACS
jgi:hypothetical protein